MAAFGETLFQPDACLLSPYAGADTPAQTEIAALVSDLRSHGDAFPSLLEALDRREPRICIDDRSVDVRGHFDVESNLIALKAALNEGQRLAVLIHELRHLDQVARAACPTDEIAMTEFAHAVFAIEADASAVTAHVGFEMAKAGDARVQAALEGFEHYSDILLAYAEERDRSGSVPLALSAAFSRWYASDWRIERYYVSSCSDYLDRADESHRLPSYDRLTEAFYTGLCLLPDGAAYPCEPPDNLSR